MLRLINLRVQANKTITINNPIKLKQGDFNVAKLVINPSLYIKDYTNVLGFISFKRPDNKQTGQLLLTKEPDNTYTYVIKDPWLVDIAGELWFTISFDKILKVENGNPVVDQRLYTGNASIYLDPDADYTIGGYLPPNDTEQILTLLTDIENRVSVTEQEIDNKLNKDFTTYPKLDWETVEDTDLVVLNRIDDEGNVTQYNAEAKDLYNSVNDIFPNEDGNIEVDASDIPYENTNVAETLNTLEETTIKTNENVVYYSEIETTNEPVVEVIRAQYAINDNNGNNIVDTYSTKTELTSIASDLTNKINTDIANVNSDIMNVEGDISSLEADLSTYEFNTNSRIDSIVKGRTPAGIAKEALNSWEVNNIMITKDDNGSIKADDNILIQSKLILSNVYVTTDMQSATGYYNLNLSNYAVNAEYKFIISYNDNTENNNIRTYIINYYNKGNNTLLATQTQAGTLNISTSNDNIRINLFNTSTYSNHDFNIDKIYIIYE